jgi:hypothetical protein
MLVFVTAVAAIVLVRFTPQLMAYLNSLAARF